MPRRVLALFAVLVLAGCAGPRSEPSSNASSVQSPLQDVLGVSDSSTTQVELQRYVSIESYAVRGVNASELRTNLNRFGPYSVVDGRRYDAITLWSLTWSTELNEDKESCSLGAAVIDLSVVVQLPELASNSLLPQRTLESWQTYVQSLKDHEAGHVERQIAIAEALQRRFEAAPVYATCEELTEALDATGVEHVLAGREADRAYDQQTGHGKSQGAEFP